MFTLINNLIVTPIINILFVIFHFVGDFGVAIVIFTILVKFITWPLIKKNLLQAKRMKEFGPELIEIRKRCKGNKQLETMETLDFYRRHKIRPFRSFFTILIQLPIFIALFTAISIMVLPTTQDNISKRAYPNISQLPTIDNLIQKQSNHLSDPKNKPYEFQPQLLGIVNLNSRANLSDLNGLAVLLFCFLAAFMQYLIMKSQMQATNKRTLREIFKDAAAGKEADQAEINSIVAGQMTKTMPIMIFLVNINFPGALVFYYFINNVIYYIQQKLIFSKITQTNNDTTKDIQEAKIIKSTSQKSKTNITRISAKSSQKRRLK